MVREFKGLMFEMFTSTAILMANNCFQLTDSGVGGCPGAAALRAVMEDLSLSPGTVTLPRLLPMVELIAQGSHQNEGLAKRTNVS